MKRSFTTAVEDEVRSLILGLAIAAVLLILTSCSDGTIEKEIPMTWGDSGGMDPGELGGSGREKFSKVTGWGGSGEMVTGDTSKTVGAQANFDEPGDYTVQFSMQPQGPDAPPLSVWAPIQAIATVRWSVAGITIIRKLSLVNGASISGVGQGVTVTVEDVTTARTVAYQLGRPYKVGITIAKGTRASDTVPPILFLENVILTLAPSSGPTIPIPQNCGVKSVLVTAYSSNHASIPEQGIQVQQLDPNNAPLAGYDARSMFFAPVVPGAVSIELFNSSLSTLKVSVIFGIEG